MRKILKILSILNCICCCYCMTMFINPIILDNTDMGGFYVIFFGIILSTVMALVWTIFAFRKQKNNNKLKIITIVSLIVDIAFIINWIFPFSAVAVVLQSIIPIISNILFIVYSKWILLDILLLFCSVLLFVSFTEVQSL